MSDWGSRAIINELEDENARLRAWKELALKVLTDNQLDFKPAQGPTLRERLRATLDKRTKA